MPAEESGASHADGIAGGRPAHGPAVTGFAVLLVLAAAGLHATWNAMLRSHGDRLWSVTVMSVASTLGALPAFLLLPSVAGAAWPYIGLSASLHVGYSLVLVQAYRHGDFLQVYPIARGSAPLLVTLGAALLAGERPSAAALAGIALVSLGILSLARPAAGARPASLAYALLTGVFIACYTVSDGIGSRLSGDALAYAARLFLLYGAAMPVVFLALRRPDRHVKLRHTVSPLIGGIVSMLAYGLVIWAMSLSPLGPVAALRETSVVFATLIGRLFLREALTLRRAGAACVIAAGAVCLGLAA